MASTVKLADVVPSRFVHLTPPDEANIERIRADLEYGSKILLNVPHVFRNEAGKWELLAGHDRAEAARRAGWTEIPVRDFSGLMNHDDAILGHFCKENLLRKDVSKAAVAGEWLGKHPDWSDGVIAEHSGCSREHVSVTRAELGVANPQVLATSRTGRDGKTRTYKPQAERKPRTTPAKPQSNADEWARQIAENAAKKAAAASPPASGAVPVEKRSEQEAPEPQLDGGSTGTGHEGTPDDCPGVPEVGEPTGARSPLQNLGTSEQVPTSTAPAEHDAAGDPQHAAEAAQPGTPVTESSVGASTPNPAVVEGGAVVLPSWLSTAIVLPKPDAPLTNAEAAALDEPTCAHLDTVWLAIKQAVARARAVRSTKAAA